MPAILERFRRPASTQMVGRSSLSFDQYLSLVSQFTYNGMSYSMRGVDHPSGEFEDMVHSVYSQNNVVAAAVVTRGLLMKQTRFAWRNTIRRDANYRQLFGDQRLSILERPDPGALTRQRS